MPLKNKILNFYHDLKAEGATLIGLTISGLENIEPKLGAGGDNSLFMTLPGGRYFSADGVQINLHSYPYRLQYVHDPDMCEEYFSKWRPAYRQFKDGFIGVEVGTFEGFLTDLVLKFKKPSKYYIVDPYAVYNDITGSLSGLKQDQWDVIYASVCQKYKDKPYVEVIRKTSAEAAKDFSDESLDFVYIDGDHKQQSVYNDICAWFPKVKKGGFIAGHDYWEHQVKAGVWQYLAERSTGDGITVTFYWEFNDWWFQKPC